MHNESQAIGIGPDQSARKAVLWVAIVAGIAFLLVGDSRWSSEHILHETIEWIGIGLIAICIVGRTWCCLYIGNYKNQVLVTNGPYSVSRNPLYLFSIIGAIGVGAQVGSIAIAFVCGFVTWAVLINSAMKEEKALLTNFSESYRQYF
jgi:protein-S-isoprenylcysteine O-methyltransferase Ste14